MAIRTAYQSQRIANNAKVNAFAKIMAYAGELNSGVATLPNFSRQLNLISGIESEYTTVADKSALADQIGMYKYNVVGQDGLGVNTLFTNDF